MKFSDFILILATTTTALMAGFFFSWSVAVMLGLGKLPDREFLSAMQNVNRQILNLAFFFCFFGCLVLLPLATFLQFKIHYFSFVLCLIAAIVYLTGVFGVTVFFHLPLNYKLEHFNIASATVEEIKQMRTIFEEPWNKANHVRSIASLITVVLMITAGMVSKYIR